jgi:uncharacterized LabA/DUF88 family protein
MKERICIFIDGGNFYHLVLKKLNVKELDFDFEAFVLFLAGERDIVNMGKRFYVGTIREKEGDLRSKEMMSQQTKLFSYFKKCKWEIKTSKLKTRIEEILIDSRVADYKNIQKLGIRKITIERLREKGIDVKLTTDLIVGAIDNKYDTAILISSDSDLIPAIDWVRYRTKKKVEYIGFSILDKKDLKNNTTPLLSMISKTDIQRTLVESDLRAFILSKLIP